MTISTSKMLDTAETQALTISHKSKVIVRPRSPSRVARMMPRRLIQCVKVATAIIAIALIVIIIAAATKGKNVFNIINFQNIPDDTLQDGLSIGHMVFDRFTKSMVFEEPQSFGSGSGHIYVSFTLRTKHFLHSAKLKPYKECVKTPDDRNERVLCLEFNNIISAVYKKNVDGMDCHVVHWERRENEEIDGINTVLDQCIDMREIWYGGGALSEQRWPLNRVNVPMQPYITQKFNRLDSRTNTSVHFESYLEPYFVSASGTAIVLDPFLPLFVSINENKDKKICFKSVFDTPYKSEETVNGSKLLKFRICKDQLARDVHKHLLKNDILDRALSTPNMDILQKSVWSTRGIDVRNINEKITLAFIDSLEDSHLNSSQIFIDGNYSRFPGSVYFDERKFPHSAQLAMQLDFNPPHKKLKMATEVYPLLPQFMSSKNFSYPNSRSVDSNDKSGAVLLDVSNTEAVNWLVSQLNTIKAEVKIKGFRFSGGQASSVLDKSGVKLWDHRTKTNIHPNQITQEYGKIAGKFTGNSFLGSGYKSQSHGLVADAGPFLASWTHRKGLKSVIPTVITYGIMGYPFVSAGPVGGIDFRINSSSGHFSLSDRNLYLRWMELATFLPTIEFSVGPWQYDERVVNMTRRFIGYRQNEIWPRHLLPAIKEASETGIPVIRPLWWVAPKDQTAQFIDCEFMVGDSLLVAPVLERGHTARQVYLPFGAAWQDLLRDGRVHEGGQWLRNYRVEEFEIAHFVRVIPKSQSDPNS